MNNLKSIKGKDGLPRKKKKAMKKEMEYQLSHFVLMYTWNRFGVSEEQGKRIARIMAKD